MRVCVHVWKSILKRLADAEGKEYLSFTLRQLSLEELLSEEQHLELDKALLKMSWILHAKLILSKVGKSGRDLSF